MILAIDLGSTRFKTAVYTDALQLLGCGHCQIAYTYPDRGGVEIAPAVVETGCRESMQEALTAAGIVASALSAVIITSQAQTFTLLDQSMGKPCCPFISWQDERAQQDCEQAKHVEPWVSIGTHASFGVLIAGMQAAAMLRMRREGKRLAAGHIRVLPLPSYLVYLLSGDFVADDNLLAMSGLYSLSRRDWWEEALVACGYSRQQMPRLCAVGDVAARTGMMAEAFGLPAGLPILFAGNDQTAGAYGAQIHAHGNTLLTLGTAFVAYSVRDALPVPDLAPCIARGLYPGGRYYKLATSSCGGNVITWAATTLLGEADYDAFFALALSAPPGSRGITFIPDLLTHAGAWQQLHVQHTRADLARAVLETLARNATTLVHQVRRRNSTIPVLVAGCGITQPGWIALLSQTAHVAMQPITTDPLFGAARVAQRCAFRQAVATDRENAHVYLD